MDGTLGALAISIVGAEKDAVRALNVLDKKVDALSKTVIGAGAKNKTAMDQWTKKLKTYGKSMEKVGKGMTKFVTLPLLGLGAVVVKTTKDYEQALTNAVSVTGLTGKAAKKAKKEMDSLALKMGRDTAFSAKEAADAMYDLASSGWTASDMTKGLRGIMDLAAATQTDLTSTTETVTSTIAQFGLAAKDSSRVADVFTAAIGKSKAKMSSLALAMRYAGPITNSLGWSLEETTAVLGKLFDAGFKGEQAGTALRGALAKLINPTKDSTKAIEGMGLKIEDLNPKTHEAYELIDILRKKHLSAAEASKIFGIEAAPAILALVNMKKEGKNGAEMIKKLTGKLNKAGGTAKRVAENQLNTLGGQLKILKGSLETAAISFGKVLVPVIKDAATQITPLVNKLAQLPPATQKIILGFAGLALVTGPLLIGLGKVFQAVAILAPFLANPLTIAIGAVIIGVGLLVTAVYRLQDSYYKEINGAYRVKIATDNLTRSKKEATRATKKYQDAEDDLKQAHINYQRAVLRVKDAQTRYTKAVKDYGPKSREAKEAALDLEQANLDVKDSSRQQKVAQDKVNKTLYQAMIKLHDVTTKTKELKKAIKNVNKNNFPTWKPTWLALIGPIGTFIDMISRAIALIRNFNNKDIKSKSMGVISKKGLHKSGGRQRGGWVKSPGLYSLVEDKKPEYVLSAPMISGLKKLFTDFNIPTPSLTGASSMVSHSQIINNRKAENHFHIGYLVNDKSTLQRFARDLKQYLDAESNRVG